MREGGAIRLLGLALLALCLARPAAAQVRQLAADEVAAAVAGNTLTGYWENAQLKQYFATDGAALRQRNREAVARGRWWLESGLLCTEYPAVDGRRCFAVQRQADRLVLFEAPTGYPLHASLVPGNVLAGVAAPAPPGEAGRAPPGAARGKLSRDDLMAANYADDGPVDNAQFMAVGAAGPARHHLSGSLRVPDFALQGRIEFGHGYEWFPGFEIELFSDGDVLLPAARGLIRAPGSKSGLSIALSPGRVWSEPADGGLSRAAFPFLLANPASDSAHNGIASFLFDDRTVSSLRIQVVQELSPGFKLNAWGQTPMRYTPGPLPAELRRRLAAEAEARTPLRPWAELAERHGLEAAAEAAFGPPSDDLSAAGLIVDGVAYALPCRTRYGDFPFCAGMRHDAGAMAASFAALPALLHLAQRHGAWVMDQRIAAVLPAAADADGWERVTFADALHMASGIGRPAPPGAFSPELMNARRSREAARLDDKLAWILKDADGAAAPGAAFHYREGDTLVLAAALDRFLKREAGPATDLWDEVGEAVLKPLGIGELPLARSELADGRAGPAPMNGGLYLAIDDVARLAGLIQRLGRVGDRQLLYAPPLESLLDFGAGKGLETGIAGRRYFLSFWLWPYARTNGDCRLWLPVASGGIGQLVVLLPHGLVAFRFADDRRLPVEAMARLADRVRPFCP